MTHHHSDSGHEHPHAPKRGLHRDWRVWVAVLLMLAGMVVYVFLGGNTLEPLGPAGGDVAPQAAE